MVLTIFFGLKQFRILYIHYDSLKCSNLITMSKFYKMIARFIKFKRPPKFHPLYEIFN